MNSNVLLHRVIFPEAGDRTRHGNVSAYPHYVSRCKEQARKDGAGLAMIHTHPMEQQHQDVSSPDLHYEQNVLAPEVFGVTRLPLVGMTLAGDSTWSARAYPRPFKIRWCSVVKTVGERLRANFHPNLAPPPRPGPGTTRTASVWGEERQADIARFRIGVIGAGSVGAAVGEALARMGAGNVVLMDYDAIEMHNLDRMLGATAADVGKAKADVVEENLKKSATLDGFDCKVSAQSIVEAEGFSEALDCDVVFSCVDRPWARQVLNHMSYSCLIPVVDGAIDIDSPGGQLRHAIYRAQTVGPGRACMDCLGALDVGSIQQDRGGLFDDPGYLGEQARRDGTDARQNVMPFVFGLAGVELMQFVEMVTGLAKNGNLSQQQYEYATGEMKLKRMRCRAECGYAECVALGDARRPHIQIDKSRARAVARNGRGGGSSGKDGTTRARRLLRAVAGAFRRKPARNKQKIPRR